MASTLQSEGLPSRPRLEPGPFVLRTLLHDVPLSADGDEEDIKINCVDYWGMHALAPIDAPAPAAIVRALRFPSLPLTRLPCLLP